MITKQAGIYLLASILIIFSSHKASGQPGIKNNGWNFSLYYKWEKVTGGHLQVREWDVPGSRLELKEIGLNSYPSLELQLKKQFQKGNKLIFGYENYFIRGTTHLDRNIEYNGTVINGKEGIDVSPTRFFRLTASYYGNLYSQSNLKLQFIGGLVYDHTTFYLDGKVVAGSPRSEVYEQFGKQALPYPKVGVGVKYDFRHVNSLNAELSGTSIPKFKSFFQEGGNMYLSYSTFLADLNYSRYAGRWNFTGGIQYRTTHLFEESHEDTNDLRIAVVSPYVGIGITF